VSASRQTIIRLEGLVYEVAGRPVLDGLNLEVYRGEVTAILGLSGSGKTTLLRLIVGLIAPRAGRIEVMGREIGRLSEREMNELRLRMGLVFQGSALFDSLNVKENVAFGLREHRRLPERELQAQVEEKLRLVGMEGSQGLMPDELSGGMRKRVAVARALALEPELMLYDEPTAGLDPITAAAMDQLILDLREELGMTSVVVSHDVASVKRVADRAALLYQGRILAEGPPAELEKDEQPAVRQFLEGRLEGPISVRG
jgi:phospholipid/cholesterol/gamma-HCH transport system ATP-binding protein